MRILFAEDELVLCDQIKKVLMAEGRIVDVANDGQEACFMGATEPFDMIILDLGRPIRDGISVLREWRSQGVATPVLILTARDGWSDRVKGLDAGADDYRTKPFHLPELAARVRASLRRSSGRATLNGVPVDLTSQEVAVLSYLIHNAGRLISRTELSEHIYEYDGDRESNTIAVFINRLRKKLGAELIRTMRGRGYMIDQA